MDVKSFKECELGYEEDMNCSDGEFFYSISDHLEYYNENTHCDDKSNVEFLSE